MSVNLERDLVCSQFFDKKLRNNVKEVKKGKTTKLDW